MFNEHYFDEYQFKEKMARAMEHAKLVLENTRNPQLAEDVPHHYQDKFLLTEYMANVSIASQLICLVRMGLTPDHLVQISKSYNSVDHTISLSFESQETCKFIRKDVRLEEPTAVVETVVRKESSSDLLNKISNTMKSLSSSIRQNTVTYVWQVETTWILSLRYGHLQSSTIVLGSHQGSQEYVTKTDQQPFPDKVIQQPNTLDISILFENYDFPSSNPKFAIDRTHKDCHTPRRNKQSEDICEFAIRSGNWTSSVVNYFHDMIFRRFNSAVIEGEEEQYRLHTTATKVFIPVVAFMEELEGDQKVMVNEMNVFLTHYQKTLDDHLVGLNQVFPNDSRIASVSIGKLMLLLDVFHKLNGSCFEGLQYVESMLRQQLVSAIGKHVSTQDLSEYMIYHNRKVFKEEYRPKKVCISVRRPDHVPEGEISIQYTNRDGIILPIEAFTCHAGESKPMRFNVNASTEIKFIGDHYLHGWLNYEFSEGVTTSLSISCRARQFSSYIMMIGTIIGDDAFEPVHAMIVKDKDDLKIPIMLQTIPSAKAFKDAISSLSPEQQRFAKAFRGMQLSSTLFAITIIQIKPALEKVLCLPNDSLTKEIQLSQDLMKLFIEYQIPSDILAYDGNEGNDMAFKISKVSENVKKMMKMINDEKEAEREEIKAINSLINSRVEEAEELSANAVFYKKSKAVRKSVQMPMMRSAPVAMSCAAPVDSYSMDGMMLDEGSVGNTEITNENPTTSTAKDTSNTASTEPKLADKGVGYTKLPVTLDAKYETFDKSGAVSPYIIKAGVSWDKTSYKGLTGKKNVESLNSEELKTSKNQAFDLLDALTKSGGLEIGQSSVHIFMGGVHVFDDSVMDTLVKKNVNPIEKIELSSFVLASVIHSVPMKGLIGPEFVEGCLESNAVIADDQ